MLYPSQYAVLDPSCPRFTRYANNTAHISPVPGSLRNSVSQSEMLVVTGQRITRHRDS